MGEPPAADPNFEADAETPPHAAGDAWLQAGMRLHAQVPAERWCVTRADLIDLRRQVRQAVLDGRITPTSQDPFDLGDQLVGPSIYTVTEQLIIPVTAEAGGMGWALMRHPGGLDCDLFITHAWMEGVYEFIDKVLNSWPRSAKHAWCCMLAMPQNLDISALISSPKESPFAKALAHAPRMLVVPNRRGSIYTRLWCAYEAFLAQQQNKIIRTAVAPYWKRALSGMLCMALVAAFTMAVGAWIADFHLWGAGVDSRAAGMLSHFFLVLSLVVYGLPARLAINVVGSVVSGYAMACYNLARWHNVLYFIVAEADRIHAKAAEAESRQLLHGYRGSVRHAACAKEADAQSIRADIGEQTCKVDQTVDVLIRAKMSTPLLTRLSQAGVEIKDAGHREWAFIVSQMAKIPFSILSYTLKGYSGGLYYMLVSTVALKIAWAVLTLLLPPDRQALAMRATAKVVVPYYLFNMAYELGILMEWTAKDDKYHLLNHAVKLHAWFWVFALTAVPPDVVARVPGVGPKVVQFLISRECALWWRTQPSQQNADGTACVGRGRKRAGEVLEP